MPGDRMLEALLTSPWPLAILLIYLMVTAILGALAFHRRNQIELHDRVRQCRALRQEYLEAAQQRRQARQQNANPLTSRRDPSPTDRSGPPSRPPVAGGESSRG